MTDERLDDFFGTPLEYAQLLGEIGWMDPVKLEPGTDTIHGPGTRVSFVTHGYSENEHLISHVERTMFNTLFWESSHRGGLHVYFVPDSQADWEMDFKPLYPECSC